jgi:uncharacterized protein YjiS (DUF1127 family)
MNTTPSTLPAAMMTLSPLSTLPGLSPGFGRVARSDPAPALAGGAPAFISRGLARSLRRHGVLATTAHQGALALERAAELARQFAQRWSQRRQHRDTVRALAALDAGTLRDLAIGASEISSLAAEAAGQVEASRRRAQPPIGVRVV